MGTCLRRGEMKSVRSRKWDVPCFALGYAGQGGAFGAVGRGTWDVGSENLASLASWRENKSRRVAENAEDLACLVP